MFVQAIIESLPAHKDRLNECHQNQATCRYYLLSANHLLPIWLAKSEAKRTDQQVLAVSRRTSNE